MTNNQLPAGRAAVGHPVDVASGAVFTVAHDFDLPGTMPFLWRRHYATDSSARTVLGPRWTTPFLMTLEIREEGPLLIEENGVPILFPWPAQPLVKGESIVNPYANMELRRDADGFTIAHWHHGSSDLEIWHFHGTAGVLPLVSIENAAGHRFVIEYDAAGKPVSVTQEIEQRRVTMEYGRNGLLTAVLLEQDEAPPAPLIQYTYSASGLLESAVDAIGATVRYEYDEMGRMLVEQNALGSSFHFRYDDQGRCVLTSGDRRYMYRKLDYQAGGKLVRVTNSLGHVTLYMLNAAGQVVQKVSPAGIPTTTEYDDFGRIARTIAADGTSRSYEYDAGGNRVAMRFEDGSIIRMSYNRRHALISFTDAAGATWHFERDGRNQLTAVVNPLGNSASFERNGLGLVTRSISPMYRSTTWSYGPRLSWWEISDAIGMRERYEYDFLGNLIAVHDAGGQRYSARYDSRNLPVEIVSADGRIWRYTYNPLGEVVDRIHPTGAAEHYEYDSFGQMTAHHNPLGVMRFAYDSEGNLIEVINRKGDRYACEYDLDSRVAREIFFDGRETRYEWNNRDWVVRETGADGIEIVFDYNPVGDVVSIRSPRGIDHTYEYDPRGFLVAAAAPGSKIGFDFDQAGRLICETQNGHKIQSNFDADDFCIHRDVLGFETGFTYDTRGRLTAITDSAGPVQQLLWNTLDQPVERRTAEGIVEKNVWRHDDRLLEQTVTAPSGILRVRRHYQYDQFNNLKSVDDELIGQTDYAYDEMGRLEQVNRTPGGQELYYYNAIGTIIESHRGPRVSGVNGQISRDGETHYRYDLAGALVEATNPRQGSTHYEYDANGQLRRAILPDGTEAEYTYDALGRRCSRRVRGRRTDYLYSGCLIAAEHVSIGGDRIFAARDWWQLAEWQNHERRFPISQLNDLVDEVLDARGNVIWKGRFEAYGRLVHEEGQKADRHRFPGQYSDSITGLCDNFFRTYDPVLAAYQSPDPIGLMGGADHYGYPRNPFFWFDPFGLKCPAHTVEDDMDAYFAKKGYKKIGPKPPKDLNTPGIDGVYKAKKGTGPPEYIIAEAKSSQSGRLGNTKYSEQQMSDTWVNTGVGGGPVDRLTAAVGPANKADMKSAAATPGAVVKTKYHDPGGTGAPAFDPLKNTKPWNPNQPWGTVY